MTPTSASSDGEVLIEHLAIVVRASDGGDGHPHRLLLIRHGDDWKLPRIASATDTSDAKVLTASVLNEAMSEQYGLSTSLLRCLFQRPSKDGDGIVRAYALEHHGDADAIPEGAMWTNALELDDLFLSHVDDRMALSAWAESFTSSSESHADWYAPGWWDEAMSWIDQALAEKGITREGPPEQVRSWTLSSVIRASTTSGGIYFKAVPQFMSHEGIGMSEMAKQYPTGASPLLSFDADKGWILMPDFGGTRLVENPDIELWERAVRTHAEMQIGQADRARSWLQMGVPDRSIRRMVDLIDPLITVSTQMLTGRAEGLSDDEIDALHGLSMRLKFMCAHLADFKIPHSLVHGDLGGNIIVDDDGDLVFFDWTDACISHPFFDMATMASTVFDDNVFKGDESVAIRIRDAYLQPWTKYEPMDRLIQAYDASRPLGALHQTMSYLWILTNIAEDTRWEVEIGLPTWIRRLLRLCGQSQ
jgi:hypothetical protein